MASTLQDLLKNKADKERSQNNAPLPTTPKQSQPLPTTAKHYSKQTSGHPEKPDRLSPPAATSYQTTTSPSKNFTKVPNSVTAEAIPQGLFKGLSKHTYDVLYKLTRGAINPTREIQLTRMSLMKMTGLSENTQRAHIKYLSIAGLIKASYQTGKHEGATYEVMVPEEIESIFDSSQVVPSSTNSSYPLPTTADDYQKLGGVPSQKLGVVSSTLLLENKQDSDSLKTYNTYKTDDEERKRGTYSILISRFDEATKKITGKFPAKNEAEKWGTLADLLILELEISASRAGNVSSVPAFLTEVLRRQFFYSRRQQKSNSARTTKPKPDTVGKAEAESFEIKPLDQQGRETALAELSEFAEENFLADFAKWYTADDWQWLSEQLNKKK